MAEGQVSLDGETRPLPRPFLVLATLNPQEQQGTYPLPESQLDRFLLRIALGYPEFEAERRLLVTRRAEDPIAALEPVASVEDVLRLQAGTREVRLDDAVADYILSIAAATRRDGRFALGASTRGTLALAAAARAHALLSGRNFVVPEDVKALAVPVLAHRVVIAGRDDGAAGAAEVIEELLHSLPVPEYALTFFRRLAATARLWWRVMRMQRVTRDGWFYLAFTLAVGVAAINTGNNLLYLVLGLLVSVLLLSAFLSETVLSRLRIEREVPPYGVAGQPFRVGIVVHNRKRRLASHSLVISEVGIEGARTYVARVGPGESVRAY